MPQPLIWIVEDHEKIRANFHLRLSQAGYGVEGFSCAEDVLDQITGDKATFPDLMLLDIRLGRMSGVDLIQVLAKAEKLPLTIVVSGEATISETVTALRLGIYDFIEKPVSKERLLQSVQNALDHHQLRTKVKHLESKLGNSSQLLGESEAMLQVKRDLAKIAPTEGRVLILGESGTGKELAAQFIHRNSTRQQRPFLKINCAAIPANLIEAELFGHVRGAFTGAATDKPGLFEAANGGTLFLDEIGDMELALQSRLLRVLEDGHVRRIGDIRDRKVDVRIVTATHRNLEEMVAEGRFRQDLFFRINTLPVSLPALRERASDIPFLAEFFFQKYCQKNGMRQKAIHPQALNALVHYHWPGNVRELKNLCERLVILAGDPVMLTELPSPLREGTSTLETSLLPPNLALKELSLREFRILCEREYIEQVLNRTNRNFTKAASILDIQRTYLYQKVHSLQVSEKEE